MRLQLLLAARGGCALTQAVKVEADRAKRALPDARVIGLVQVEGDVFPLANPLCRPFEAVLELQTTEPSDAHRLIAAVDGAAARLEPLIHADLSGVLIGTPKEIIPCDVTPVRYLYLMRRRHTHTREQYFDYYYNHHSRFGHRTPGIVGYTQFHVDDLASLIAARALGVGAHGADSVSELHLNSVEEFFAALAAVPNLGDEAGADEALFVDRDNSKSFTTSTVVQL